MIPTKLSIIIFLPIVLFSCLEKKESVEKTISEIMRKQQECWNKGDIECFMQNYWHDDSLRFVGKEKINYGWQKTFDNYKKSYPTKEDMGELTFTLEEVKVFTASEAYVLGKWYLKIKEKENIGGYFSLLWRKIDGKWVIVSDHTS